MRITGLATIALLALTLTTAAAWADDAPAGGGRNFGTAPCGQKFSCAETPPSQLTAMATSCAASGLGVSPQTGVFSSASFDSSNCITGVLPPNSNGRALTTQCCVIPNGDTCSMTCTLVMH